MPGAIKCYKYDVIMLRLQIQTSLQKIYANKTKCLLLNV